jgi:hypothetical protein
MLTDEKIQNPFDNNVFAFIGGFVGAMSHYIVSIRILLNLNFQEILDFTVHSLIGGVVMLLIKIANDGLIYLIKKHIITKAQAKDIIEVAEVELRKSEEIISGMKDETTLVPEVKKSEVKPIDEKK